MDDVRYQSLKLYILVSPTRLHRWANNTPTTDITVAVIISLDVSVFEIYGRLQDFEIITEANLWTALTSAVHSLLLSLSKTETARDIMPALDNGCPWYGNIVELNQ